MWHEETSFKYKLSQSDISAIILLHYLNIKWDSVFYTIKWRFHCSQKKMETYNHGKGLHYSCMAVCSRLTRSAHWQQNVQLCDTVTYNVPGIWHRRSSKSYDAIIFTNKWKLLVYTRMKNQRFFGTYGVVWFWNFLDVFSKTSKKEISVGDVIYHTLF